MYYYPDLYPDILCCCVYTHPCILFSVFAVLQATLQLSFVTLICMLQYDTHLLLMYIPVHICCHLYIGLYVIRNMRHICFTLVHFAFHLLLTAMCCFRQRCSPPPILSLLLFFNYHWHCCIWQILWNSESTSCLRALLPSDKKSMDTHETKTENHKLSDNVLIVSLASWLCMPGSRQKKVTPSVLNDFGNGQEGGFRKCCFNQSLGWRTGMASSLCSL